MERSVVVAESGTGHSYKEVCPLKRGSFGQVLLAEEASRGELVALKLIGRAEVAANPAAIEREILNHSVLNHPHIVKLKEVFLTDDYLVLVLEYLEGGDLAQLLHAPCGGLRHMPEPAARWVFTQLLFALDYLHRVGLADRDIKLDNILMARPSTWPIIKLADFGLSAQCDAAGRTSFDGPIGTPLFFAPELLSSAREHPVYNARAADIWACGVLLSLLLTGASPFQRPEDAQLPKFDRIRRMLQRILRVQYSLPDWLSPGARDLIAATLVADPSRRPSVQDLMRHTWCQSSEGVSPEQLIRCNDALVAQTLASPPAPEILAKLRELLDEAATVPPAVPNQPAQQTRRPSMPVEDGDCVSVADLGPRQE